MFFHRLDAKPIFKIKVFPLIRLDLVSYTLFHGFDTLGSHLTEEGSLDYDGGLVRLQIQTNFYTIINHQQCSYEAIEYLTCSFGYV
jgi:hypothetical protein